MAILKSKQLSTNLSGSYTITGSLETTANISGSSTSTGSFGRLEIGNNANIDGDITLGGNITIGDASSDSVYFGAEVSSSMIPDADSTYDVGSSSKNWRYGYIEQVSATHITASGDISSSGDITLGHTTNYAGYVAGTTNYMFTNASYQSSNGYNLGFLIASGSDIGGTAVKISGSSAGSFVGIGVPYTTPLTTELTVEGSISASGDLNIDGNVTASGNISGSYTSTGSFGLVTTTGYVGIGTTQPTYDLDVVGDIGVNQYIYHNDDDDTRINFTSDRIQIEIGGTEFLDARNTTQDYITIGGSDDIDTKLQGGDGYVFIQGSDGYIGINDDSPSYQLDVAGTGRFTGQLNADSNLNLTGHLTASGNISSSYTSTGSLGRVNTTGDIYTSGRIYESGTSVVDHATAMAIVFGG